MNPNHRRVVVKIGSSLLTKHGGHLDHHQMARFVRELSQIHRRGIELVLVSSGAISAGVSELGWGKRPADLAKKQAAAAVGQPRLMETYRALFRRQGISIAQVLLTKEDFENKKRLHNARVTLDTLLAARVIPIINENDTVAVEEIRVGDNDTLGARVAVNLRAHLLILLTDVDGLYSKPPQQGLGDLIARVEKVTAHVEALAHSATGTDRGTGGMLTKIRAAKIATTKGSAMVIANGQKAGLLLRIIRGESVGTFFAPSRRSS